jgi:hypothetical protein
MILDLVGFGLVEWKIRLKKRKRTRNLREAKDKYRLAWIWVEGWRG